MSSWYTVKFSFSWENVHFTTQGLSLRAILHNAFFTFGCLSHKDINPFQLLVMSVVGIAFKFTHCPLQPLDDSNGGYDVMKKNERKEIQIKRMFSWD